MKLWGKRFDGPLDDYVGERHIARNVTAEVEIVQKCDMISKMYGNCKLHIMHSLQSKGMEQWLDAHEFGKSFFLYLVLPFFGICSSESPFFVRLVNYHTKGVYIHT